MKRAIITLTATAAGMAALLSFKIHTPPAEAEAAPAPAPSASPAAATAAAAGAAAKGAKGTASQGTDATAARTVTGTVANTAHGPMQVQLVVTGQKITKVNLLQQTNDGQESVQIDSTAIPKLVSETLAAQSAKIDAVSGASYTSSGYIQSLQSAVDQLHA